MTTSSDLRFPPADETHYVYDKEAVGEGSRYGESTVGNVEERTCRSCGKSFNWAFKVGNAMTDSTPAGVAHAVDNGASRGYCTIECFMAGDSDLEQATLDR
ncbi:MAG: hypothetical protein NZ782_01275, partial [Candidatus Poseidoniia archaeon]|nr:hypothetical protein [Candidatus Poseidoniia archaeon]